MPCSVERQCVFGVVAVERRLPILHGRRSVAPAGVPRNISVGATPQQALLFTTPTCHRGRRRRCFGSVGKVRARVTFDLLASAKRCRSQASRCEQSANETTSSSFAECYRELAQLLVLTADLDEGFMRRDLAAASAPIELTRKASVSPRYASSGVAWSKPPSRSGRAIDRLIGRSPIF